MRLAVHTLTLRRLRELVGGAGPDVITGAAMLDMAGADGIVARLSNAKLTADEQDVKLLKAMVKSYLSVEVEPKEAPLRRVMDLHPDQVTLIPPEDSMREDGLDVVTQSSELEVVINSLKASGIDVSILVAPDITQIKEARKIGADFITLNAASFTGAETANEAMMNLEEIETVAMGAVKLGLRVLVTRGINHRNIAPLAAIDSIEEAILGHAFYARAIYVGMDRAFKEVVDSLHRAGMLG